MSTYSAGPVLGDPPPCPLTAAVLGMDLDEVLGYGRRMVMVVVIRATDRRSYLSTHSDYIPSHDVPCPHKQTTPSTTNTRNGPVAPQ